MPLVYRRAVDADGNWADFECISPGFVDNPLCTYAARPRQETGDPVLAARGQEELQAVSRHGEGFTLWFAEGLVIDRLIRNDFVTFLVAGDRLVGIEAARMLGQV